ncbi:MAG: cohesin domain-containing protein [Pseudomonadota bacterium]|nr:cohesin domain-containing protein [Pseudomonadota bacterium]
MKYKKSFLSCFAIVAALLFGLLAPAWSATAPVLDLVPNGSAVFSATKQVEFSRGSDFYLNVTVDNINNIAGAAFTINYDATYLEPPVIDTAGLSEGISSPLFTTFTDTRGTSNVTETVRRGGQGVGKILLSGAMIDSSTGGAKVNPDSNGVLFKLKFKVKENAPYNTPFAVSLTATTLNNTAAGYAAGGEAIPLLVGAVDKRDPNWGNLTAAFPVLLASLVQPLSLSCSVVEARTRIQGEISYTGKQGGTLKVGAYRDSALTQFVEGSGYSVAWPGTGTQTYTLFLPRAGNYYVGAYIDSPMPNGSAANNQKDAWEAQGQFASAITVAADETVTGKDFTLVDPDTGGVGLPDWWRLKYGVGADNAAKLASLNDRNADYDKDGYSNLVEYQGYKADGTGMNPTTVQEAPGGSGYNAATDNRNYNIAGTVYYTGTQTGTLYVKGFAASDVTFQTPLCAATPAVWSGTSKAYTMSCRNGSYVVRAFINPNGQDVVDSNMPQGVSTPVTLAGTALNNVNLTLIGNEPTQKVYTNPANPSGRSGGSFSMDVMYDTSDHNQTLTGLGLRIHYDPTKVTFDSFSNVLSSGNPTQDSTPMDDTLDYDNDPATTKYLTIAWSDLNGAWPGTTLPLRLYTVKFNVPTGLADNVTSAIRFSVSSKAAGYLFSYTPALFKVQSFNYDVDANAVADALTDGLLVIRYLFGFTGDTLIGKAVATDATRKTATDIETYLQGGLTLLDVDGNGAADALTDGLLVIRYLFGFTGDTLISKAVATDATRKTATEIEAYMLQFMPPQQ